MTKKSAFAAKTAYESALAAYEAFRTQHQDVLEEHDHLAVALAEAHEELKREFRENHSILGQSFAGMRISVPRNLDPTPLVEEMGEEEVEKLPFIKKKYTIDSKAFDEAMRHGLIAADLAEMVVSEGAPRITGGPKKLPTIYQP
jgi:hypothetical protein